VPAVEVNVALADVFKPLAVPKSSAKLATTILPLDLIWIGAESAPPAAVAAATLVITLVDVEKLILLESRNNKPGKLAFNVNAADSEIAPEESSVNTPPLKLAPGVQAPANVKPAVLLILPIRRLVERISLNMVVVNCKPLAPPATLIATPALDGCTMVFLAKPAPVPVPPICVPALKVMLSPIKLMVPTVPAVLPTSNCEFKVSAPVNESIVKFAASVCKLIGLDAAWVTPTLSSVNNVVANAAGGVQLEPLPTVIKPEVLLPICTFAPRITFNVAAVNCKLPAPPATPIVLAAVLGCTITVFADPAPAPVPPICEAAFQAAKSSVKVIVPVDNNNEAEPSVSVPVPELTFSAAVPELTDVLAFCR